MVLWSFISGTLVQLKLNISKTMYAGDNLRPFLWDIYHGQKQALWCIMAKDQGLGKCTSKREKVKIFENTEPTWGGGGDMPVKWFKQTLLPNQSLLFWVLWVFHHHNSPRLLSPSITKYTRSPCHHPVIPTMLFIKEGNSPIKIAMLSAPQWPCDTACDDGSDLYFQDHEDIKPKLIFSPSSKTVVNPRA